MTFGERLDKSIKESNYTQKELAEKIGVTPVRLNYWVKDKRQPDVLFIKLLANALCVSADYLIGNDIPAALDLSPEAQSLGRLYDRLDPHSQRIVYTVATMESERKPEPALPKGIMPISALPFHNIPNIGTLNCTGELETRHAARQELAELESSPDITPVD